jgi:hypothetical protein
VALRLCTDCTVLGGDDVRADRVPKLLQAEAVGRERFEPFCGVVYP